MSGLRERGAQVRRSDTPCLTQANPPAWAETIKKAMSRLILLFHPYRPTSTGRNFQTFGFSRTGTNRFRAENVDRHLAATVLIYSSVGSSC